MIGKMQKLETLTELRELNLSRNCIKAIECMDNMAKLENFNLSGNQITSVPRQTMKKLRSLKVLKLSHNKFESVSCDDWVATSNKSSTHYLNNAIRFGEVGN
jgi:Leucine-rich repeat (LRR) protein